MGAEFDAHGGLLDTHSDATHNRSVFTLRGRPGELREALAAGARSAIAEIDTRAHEGAHPCIGAIDVCPILWADPADRERAVAEARAVAEDLAALDLPVFLYGDLATAAKRRERAYFRNGGIDELERRMASGEVEPDLGPSRLHPS